VASGQCSVGTGKRAPAALRALEWGQGSFDFGIASLREAIPTLRMTDHRSSKAIGINFLLREELAGQINDEEKT
jgi:hypothetical protein